MAKNGAPFFNFAWHIDRTSGILSHHWQKLQVVAVNHLLGNILLAQRCSMCIISAMFDCYTIITSNHHRVL